MTLYTNITDAPGSSLRIGDRSSDIVEERLSGWISWCLSPRFSNLGFALGVVFYPFVVASWYGHTGGSFMLVAASGLFFLGMVLVALVSAKSNKSGGCLSTVLAVIVLSIALRVSGTDVPRDSMAWLYLWIPCLLVGVPAIHAVAVPIGAFCALGPALIGRKLFTITGAPYHRSIALFQAIAYLFVSPIIGLILGWFVSGERLAQVHKTTKH